MPQAPVDQNSHLALGTKAALSRKERIQEWKGLAGAVLAFEPRNLGLGHLKLNRPGWSDPAWLKAPGLPPDERKQVARFVVEQDDSWIPDAFKESTADAQAGRVVDMETALFETPPPRLQ